MFRKTLLASAVLLALLPSVAGALGLGGIRTQSALNEPFSGRIDLYDVKAEELDSVKVTLASESEFSKVGAERFYFLTRLVFRPQVLPQGRTVILVTSKDPVREPFLDFLIEVNWPKGRLVKEYTVLLDPPVTLNRPPPRVEQPAIERQAPRPASGSAAASGVTLARPPASVDTSAFPMRHGPVAPGTSLWRIARDMAPATGATVAQTAMALYRNNHSAFIRGNINKLKVDEVLEVPTATELFALDTGAAEREFATALRGGRVTSSPLTDITAAPQPKDRLEIAGMEDRTPTVQTEADALPAQVPPDPEAAEDLAAEAFPETMPEQIPTPVDEATAARETGPELDSIEQDLLLVQEAGESTRQETQELRGRIRELEGQLADIQRLLELSNERFAQLQSGELEQPEATAAEAMDEPELEAGIDDEPGVPEGPQVEAALEPDEAASAQTPQPPPQDMAGAADTEPTSVSEPSFWDSVPQRTLALTLAVPLLLAVLGWMIHRRRKSLEEAWELGELELAPEGAAAGGAGVPPSEQTAQSTAEFTQVPSTDSGFASLEDEADEDDVISEADVYIAYGRYREAEALLEEEINKSPDRLDIKFKLADAYHGARNLHALETLMKQMRGAGVDRINPVQWERLDTMARDLKGADSEAPGLSSETDERPTLQVVETSERLESAFPPPLSSGGEPLTDASAPDAAITDDLGSTSQEPGKKDLELDVSDLELVDGGVSAPDVGDTLEMSGAASDLELKLEDLEGLDDVDLTSLSEAAPPIDPVSTEAMTEALDDSEGASLDITPISKDSAGSEFLSSQWQADSGIWDEVATKLDLARAYVEMEDPDAARVILEEVAQEGTEEQRAAAREMIAQLR